MSWRDTVSIHPEADKFPLLNPADLQELADDIKKNGLRHLVRVITVDGSGGSNPDVMVVDGRNRLDALELNGERLCFKKNGRLREFYATGKKCFRMIDDGGALSYIASANLYRRHLTVEQKRQRIADLLKANPESSNLQISKQAKVDDKTVAKVRRELESRSDIPNVETRTDSKGRKQPSNKPPAKVKVNGQSVSTADFSPTAQEQIAKAIQKQADDVVGKLPTSWEAAEETAEQTPLQPTNDAEASAEKRTAEYAAAEKDGLDVPENPDNFMAALLLRLEQAHSMSRDAVYLAKKMAGDPERFKKAFKKTSPEQLAKSAQLVSEGWLEVADAIAQRAAAEMLPACAFVHFHAPIPSGLLTQYDGHVCVQETEAA